MAPPPLSDFTKQKSISAGSRVTLTTVRGDCELAFLQTGFSQNVLSYQGASFWNSIPQSVKKSTSLPTFRSQLKVWFRDAQTRDHV